jgi:hypothetical protein
VPIYLLRSRHAVRVEIGPATDTRPPRRVQFGEVMDLIILAATLALTILLGLAGARAVFALVFFVLMRGGAATND